MRTEAEKKLIAEGWKPSFEFNFNFFSRWEYNKGKAIKDGVIISIGTVYAKNQFELVLGLFNFFLALRWRRVYRKKKSPGMAADA